MDKEKRGKLFQGIDGKGIELPKSKHVQVLRGLIVKILNLKVAEREWIDGLEAHFMTEADLISTISGLNYNPRDCIPQLLKQDYLVIRTPPEEQQQATYYLCPTKTIGAQLRQKKSPIAA